VLCFASDFIFNESDELRSEMIGEVLLMGDNEADVGIISFEVFNPLPRA